MVPPLCTQQPLSGPCPLYTAALAGAGPVSHALSTGETSILIFSRLWPFCVFEIVLWAFGFEGGLGGRLVGNVPALTASVGQQ